MLAWLGWVPDAELTAQAEKHVKSATLAARSYCRSAGWEEVVISTSPLVTEWHCPEDVREVIISAAARSLSNPEQAREVSAGTFRSAPGSFWSWSLTEALILNGYRKRMG